MTGFANGGVVVAQEFLAGSHVPALRDKAAVGTMGGDFLPTASGAQVIPAAICEGYLAPALVAPHRWETVGRTRHHRRSEDAFALALFHGRRKDHRVRLGRVRSADQGLGNEFHRTTLDRGQSVARKGADV